MRWYHVVCSYLFLAGAFCLAVIPEMAFGIWFGVGCVAAMILGFLGMAFLPRNGEES